MNEVDVTQVFLSGIAIILLMIGILKITNAHRSSLRNKLQQCDQDLAFYIKLDFYLWALKTDQIQLESPPQDLYEQSKNHLQRSEIEEVIIIHSKSKEEITQFYYLIQNRLAKKKEEQSQILRKFYGRTFL